MSPKSIRSLTADLTAARSALYAAQGTVRELIARCDEAEAVAHGLRGDVKAAEQAHDALKHDYDGQRNKLRETEGSLQDAFGTIRRLKEELLAAATTIARFEGYVKRTTEDDTVREGEAAFKDPAPNMPPFCLRSGPQRVAAPLDSSDYDAERSFVSAARNARRRSWVNL